MSSEGAFQAQSFGDFTVLASAPEETHTDIQGYRNPTWCTRLSFLFLECRFTVPGNSVWSTVNERIALN